MNRREWIEWAASVGFTEAAARAARMTDAEYEHERDIAEEKALKLKRNMR